MSEVIYHLRDINTRLVAAWTTAFADVPNVHPARGDIFGVQADAIISPANSFGFMDGGIDLLYTRRFGWQLQERLQAKLRQEYDGELPIGMAVILKTGDPDLPYLVSAPTMRVPADVSDTPNAYLAFRAALRVIRDFNQQHEGAIKTVLCPGLATATGQMLPAVCARQMHSAYMQIESGQPWQAQSIDHILSEHHRMLRTED